MIPSRTLKVIDEISTYSKQLSKDGLNIFRRACKPAKERACAGHDVTAERYKDLLKYIGIYEQLPNMVNLHHFIENGFNLFEDRNKWAKVEQELYIAELKDIHTRRGGSVLTAILNLAKIYFDDQGLWSPSRCEYAKSAIDISVMYLYPISWIFDFKKLATIMLENPNGHTKYKSVIGALLNTLEASRFDPIIVKHLDDEKNFNAALDNDEVFNLLLANTPKKDQSRIKKARNIHNPELHGKEAKHAPRNEYNLSAGKETRGAYWIHELSPKWFKQCQQHINGIYQDKGEREAISAITRLTKTSSAMIDHKIQLPNLDLLKNSDITAFFANENELIKELFTIDEKRLNESRGEILFMYNVIYGANLSVNSIMEYAIPFNCDSGDDRYRYIILDKLAKKYPNLAEKIAEYAFYEIRRIDGFKNSEDTVFGKVGAVHAIFNQHLDSLNENDLKLLSQHGINALEMNNCRIIKRIRYTLKQKFESDVLKRGSATQFQHAFKHFCNHFKLTEVNAHAISARKRRHHEQKISASDYYTIEEAISITYAIELALATKNLSKPDELLLRLSRIFIKTGWNLSPVLRLEIDDILELNAPLTGKAMSFVRLFKKRANYSTQFYEFDMDADTIPDEGLIFGKEVTNALADLEYIRDKLSGELRCNLKDDSKLKYRLALYKADDGTTLSFAKENFSSKVNNVLKKFECNVPFHTQRIRKGGLNYVYQKFAKNFKKYKKAGQHSLKVFLDVYLRDDGIRSEEKLALATLTMSEFFSGRPITNDIVIVTDIPPDTKQTPTGRCASQGNDEEAKAFSKSLQRLNRDSKTETSQCGDFNACLFCRHFRIVVDADGEHVWRLLSYHRYVVGEMERGVSDYDGTTDQAEYIEILNERIEVILEELSEVDHRAVENGKQLLETRGCHEDWAFLADIEVA